MAENTQKAKKKADRQKIIQMVKYGTPAQKVQTLEALFHKFDNNGSGEIDTEEFKKILRWLDMPLADEVIAELFSELDADGSGTVDVSEFVQFFNILDRYQQQLEGELRNLKVGVVKARICNFLLLAFGLCGFFFIFKFLDAKATGKDASMWLTLSIGTFSVITVGLCGVLVYPIIKMKYGDMIRERLVSASGKMGDSMGSSVSQLTAMGGKASKQLQAAGEARQQGGGPGTPRPGDLQQGRGRGGGRGGMLDSIAEDEEVGMMQGPLSQRQEERMMIESIVKPQGNACSTYRVKNMNYSTQIGDASDELQNSTMGNRDFGHRDRYGEMDDEMLVQEYAANEHLEENFSYARGNYDLAKIQQNQITPSTFSPMGTVRYKGAWTKTNNPTLTLQGTSDYVGKSIDNTNKMTQEAREIGISTNKIENIKLNSTISSGWYAGSCSPYPNQNNQRVQLSPSQFGGRTQTRSPRGGGGHLQLTMGTTSPSGQRGLMALTN